MRVLVAHNRYRLAGGEERHIDLLEEGLRDSGIDVRRFERDSHELEDSATRRVGAALTLAYRPGGGGISHALRERPVDVVHFHNVLPLMTPAAFRIAKHHGAGVVFTAHNYRFACPGGVCPSRAVPLIDGQLSRSCVSGSSLVCALRNNPRGRRAESLAYGLGIDLQRKFRMMQRWIDAYIAPTEFVADMLRRAGLPGERIHVISHGAPPATRASGRRLYAVFVGRLSQEKGLRTLLEAHKLAPEIPLVIAGDGPLADEVRASSATYLGQLGPTQMADALADAAFMVVPSEWHESFGYAIIEAFHAGVPVIASSVGGMPEVVQDGVNGLVIPPWSPPELAAAMRKLWHAPEATAALGRAARVAAEERFSLSRQIGETIELYRSVCSRAAPIAGPR